jgi:hypothetical protein
LQVADVFMFFNFIVDKKMLRTVELSVTSYLSKTLKINILLHFHAPI